MADEVLHDTATGAYVTLATERHRLGGVGNRLVPDLAEGRQRDGGRVTRRADHGAEFTHGLSTRRNSQEVPGGWWSPLGEAGRGHRRPAGLDGAVEQVAVGEMLDQEAVGIAPAVLPLPLSLRSHGQSSVGLAPAGRFHPRSARISLSRRAFASMCAPTSSAARCVSPDRIASRMTLCSASSRSGFSNSRSSTDKTMR
jgi:hypothetical protein